jgi:hypothetical protein
VTAVQPRQAPSLEALADAAVPGGPGKDGIPSIDKPRFVPANKAPASSTTIRSSAWSIAAR